MRRLWKKPLVRKERDYLGTLCPSLFTGCWFLFVNFAPLTVCCRQLAELLHFPRPADFLHRCHCSWASLGDVGSELPSGRAILNFRFHFFVCLFCFLSFHLPFPPEYPKESCTVNLILRNFRLVLSLELENKSLPPTHFTFWSTTMRLVGVSFSSLAKCVTFHIGRFLPSIYTLLVPDFLKLIYVCVGNMCMCLLRSEVG